MLDRAPPPQAVPMCAGLLCACIMAPCLDVMQTSLGSIPWQSAGHWDGLTLREQFATAYQVRSRAACIHLQSSYHIQTLDELDPTVITRPTAQLIVASLGTQAKSKYKWITVSSFNEWIAQVREGVSWHMVSQRERHPTDFTFTLDVVCLRHSPRAPPWRRQWAWRRTRHSLAAPSLVRRHL